MHQELLLLPPGSFLFVVSMPLMDLPSPVIQLSTEVQKLSSICCPFRPIKKVAFSS